MLFIRPLNMSNRVVGNFGLNQDEIDILAGAFSGFGFQSERKSGGRGSSRYNETPSEGLVVYALLLEGENFYVGITRDLDRRLSEHFSGKGSEWTKLHKPMGLIETWKNAAPIEERNITLAYMEKYGWWRVRGARWTQRNMRNPPKELR
jgi:predicted GIY-YIG superfamily endonuclease